MTKAMQVKTYQPRYKIPAKKKRSWFSEKLNILLRDQEDLEGLEFETITAIRLELEKQKRNLKIQINETQDRLVMEVTRLRGKFEVLQFFHDIVTEQARELKAAEKKQRIQESEEKARIWERSFVCACKDMVDETLYKKIVEAANETMSVNGGMP